MMSLNLKTTISKVIVNTTISLSLFLLSGCSLKATMTSMQLGVFRKDTVSREIQLFQSNTKVKGLQLGLEAHNKSLSGLAVALVSEVSPGSLKGKFSTKEEYEKYYRLDNFLMEGLQISGLKSKSLRMYGIQVSGLMSDALDGYGLQLSGIGSKGELSGGVQVSGIINRSKESFKGVQVAPILNYSKKMTGLQIGLLNFNESGFLPVFPIFNFGWGEEKETNKED